MYYYSKSTNGFYSKEINGKKIPTDAVQVTDKEYALLLDGQSAGRMIVPDSKGRPSLKDIAPQVPSIVTMRQARLALYETGLLHSVENVIDQLSEPLKTTLRIEWDYASEVNRNSTFVAMMAEKIGLDEDALDDLFTLASEL